MHMREGISGGAKVLLGILVLIVVGAIIWVFATFVFGTASNETANFRGGVEQRDLTNGNGQYRIANYDQFFATCNSLVAQQNQIDDDTANTGGLPPQIAATNLKADQQQYRTDAADYNAKAQATATSGQFQDSRLPYQVPTNYQANGAKITCAS